MLERLIGCARHPGSLSSTGGVCRLRRIISIIWLVIVWLVLVASPLTGAQEGLSKDQIIEALWQKVQSTNPPEDVRRIESVAQFTFRVISRRKTSHQDAGDSASMSVPCSSAHHKPPERFLGNYTYELIGERAGNSNLQYQIRARARDPKENLHMMEVWFPGIQASSAKDSCTCANRIPILSALLRRTIKRVADGFSRTSAQEQPSTSGLSSESGFAWSSTSTSSRTATSSNVRSLLRGSKVFEGWQAGVDGAAGLVDLGPKLKKQDLPSRYGPHGATHHLLAE